MGTRPWLAAGILLLALIPSAHLAWKSRDLPHLGHYHDDGIYWVTAKSLADGAGYRILSLPDQPYQTKYPPLYPLLLSWIWKLNPSFPDNLRLAVWFAWLILPLYLVLARVVFRDLGLGWSGGWALGAALAMNPTIVFLSINLMADLLFCCLLFACLSLAHRGAKAASGNWMAAAAGLLGGAAYLTRAAGLPLLAAGPLWFLLRRQYARAALYLGAMAPAVLAWNLWIRSHLADSSDFASLYYTNYVGAQLHDLSWQDLPTLLSNNFYFLLSAISRLIVYNLDGSFWGGFYWRLYAFASIAGAVRLARSTGVTPYHLFAAGFVPLLLVCSWPPDERLVLPVFPLLLAGLWAELRHIVQMLLACFRRSERVGKAVAALVSAGLAAFACLALYFTSGAVFRFFPEIVAQHRELLANNRQVYAWIARNLPADSTFLAYDDPLLYLYTGRWACGLPVPPRLFYREGPEGVFRLFQSSAGFARGHGLDYLLATAGDFYRGELSQSQRVALRRAIGENPAYRPLYESVTASVHRIEQPQAVLGSSWPRPWAAGSRISRRQQAKSTMVRTGKIRWCALFPAGDRIALRPSISLGGGGEPPTGPRWAAENEASIEENHGWRHQSSLVVLGPSSPKDHPSLGTEWPYSNISTFVSMP